MSSRRTLALPGRERELRALESFLHKLYLSHRTVSSHRCEHT